MKFYHITHLSTGGKLMTLVSALLSVLSPLYVIAIITLVFIAVDFALGLAVSIRYKKVGFTTEGMWNTFWKAVCAMTCIALAHVLEKHVITILPHLSLAKFFAGIICGADFYSILANSAILSDWPPFRIIRKLLKSEIKNKIGVDLSELDEYEQTKTQ